MNRLAKYLRHLTYTRTAPCHPRIHHRVQAWSVVGKAGPPYFAKKVCKKSAHELRMKLVYDHPVRKHMCFLTQRDSKNTLSEKDSRAIERACANLCTADTGYRNFNNAQMATHIQVYLSNYDCTDLTSIVRYMHSAIYATPYPVNVAQSIFSKVSFILIENY